MSRLRWELCKIWNCAANDERFKDLNSAQVLWYFEMLNQDKSDRFDLLREFVEYNATFINPEAVKKVRESRAPQNQFESTDDISNKIKDGSLFNDPLIRGIKDKYKNTNNNTNNRGDDKANFKSPLYDIIRDK